MLHCRRVFTANLSFTASHYDNPRVCFTHRRPGVLAFRTLGLLPRGLDSRRVPAAEYRASLQRETCRHWAK